MRPLVSHARLKEVLRYDSATGSFIWLVAPNGRIRVGQTAGSPNGEGYLSIKIDRRLYRAHRLAWLYMTGAFPVHTVDHVNRCGSDNRWKNLRAATVSENCRNQTARKNNKSGFKGVCWHKASGKWTAATMVDGRSTYLGIFDTPKKAHAAYQQAVEKHHGVFARAA